MISITAKFKPSALSKNENRYFWNWFLRTFCKQKTTVRISQTRYAILNEMIWKTHAVVQT